MKTQSYQKLFGFVVVALVAALLIAPLSVMYAWKSPVASADSEIYYADENYNGGGNYTQEREEFNYASKTVEMSISVNFNHPNYFNMNSALTNSCACSAGANIIAYYDRFYPNLVPGFEPGFQRPTYYSYFGMGAFYDQQQGIINDMYDVMGTNTNGAGTSKPQYNQGLADYVTSHGQNISYTSVASNNLLDLNALYNQLQAGHPVTLFLNGYNIVSCVDNGSSVSLLKFIYTSTHMMVVFGMEKVSYYNTAGQLVQQYVYLEIATCLDLYGCVYIVNHNGMLVDAEAVSIT